MHFLGIIVASCLLFSCTQTYFTGKTKIAPSQVTLTPQGTPMSLAKTSSGTVQTTSSTSTTQTNRPPVVWPPPALNPGSTSSQTGVGNIPSQGNPGQNGSVLQKPTNPQQGGSSVSTNSSTSTTDTTEQFSSEVGNGGNVDMVWIVDSSGSMIHEPVRQNLEWFLQEASTRVNLKFALVALEGTIGTMVKLPDWAKNKGFIQIDHDVQSNNPLVIAAITTCPAADSSYQILQASPVTICKNRISSLDARVEGAMICPGAVKGALSTFFRQATKHIYVIVTDDDARHVDHTNFMNLISPYHGGSTVVVHSFSGYQDSGSCKISRRGSSYEALSTQTGGSLNDVCTADWRQGFSTLLDGLGVVKNWYPLSHTPHYGTAYVNVDGRSLTTGEYVIQGNVVYIMPSLLTRAGMPISIQYKY